jgi:hypothetical protein
MHRENVALYLIHDAYSPACTVGCWFSKEKERERKNEKLKIQRLPSNVCFIPWLRVFRLFRERILLAWITERLRLMVEAAQADALNKRTSCKFRKKKNDHFMKAFLRALFMNALKLYLSLPRI